MLIMKKGLSPIISTILLIVMVLVIAGIVFSWNRYTLKTSEQEALEQKLCSEIKFVVDDFCYEDTEVYDKETGDFETKTHIRFNGRNDILDSELYGFLFFLDYGGTIISTSTLRYSELGGGEAKTLFTDVIKNVQNIKEINVIPKIKTHNKIIICETNDKTIGEGEIEQC